MKIYSILIIVALLSVGIFAGCKKSESPVETDTETQTAIDYSICEREFVQVGPTATNLTIKTKSTPRDRVIENYSNWQSTCDTLTYISGDTLWSSPGHSNPVYEYDFGTCAGYGFDGVTRTGKWRITFRQGGIRKAGASMLVQFINYKLNNVSYMADSVVFNNGGMNNGIFTYTINVYNAVCASPSWTITYSSTRSVSVDTKNTVDPTDDVVTIVSGHASGKNRNGISYSVSIKNLTKPANCKYITAGTVDITPSRKNTRTINYGNGTCDDKATVTINGNTFEITLN